MRHGGFSAALLAALIAGPVAGCGGGGGGSGGGGAPGGSALAPPASAAADVSTTPDGTTHKPPGGAAHTPGGATHTPGGPTRSTTATTTTSGGQPAPAPALAHPVPASFRDAGISPGAPSDDQVRAELQQMYAAQAHARKLSADAANFAALLPWVQERKTGELVSVASVFRDYGLGLACGGVLGVNQIGVAHKTAPCGTLIDFTYGGRTLRVPVIDRGPYIVGREWDLTGATAAALGFPGLGRIIWRCASC